jgi:lipoprotein NlpI
MVSTDVQLISFIGVILLATIITPAAPPATQPAGPQFPKRTATLEALVSRCQAILEKNPDDVQALQRRGEALCLLGRVEESVRDFDRVNALDRPAAPHNWQRGIALYYAGRFADGAAQFEQHREVNPDDVENATWHYLCVARALGPEKGPKAAREKLISIKSDRRIPMMKVHEMYSGTATPDDVIATAKAGDPKALDLPYRLFYAHLYIALYYEANGDAAKAKEHIDLAAHTYGLDVDGYMGDIARLHAWRIARDGVAAAAAATRPTK